MWKNGKKNTVKNRKKIWKKFDKIVKNTVKKQVSEFGIHPGYFFSVENISRFIQWRSGFYLNRMRNCKFFLTLRHTSNPNTSLVAKNKWKNVKKNLKKL